MTEKYFAPKLVKDSGEGEEYDLYIIDRDPPVFYSPLIGFTPTAWLNVKFNTRILSHKFEARDSNDLPEESDVLSGVATVDHSEQTIFSFSLFGSSQRFTSLDLGVLRSRDGNYATIYGHKEYIINDATGEKIPEGFGITVNLEDQYFDALLTSIDTSQFVLGLKLSGTKGLYSDRPFGSYLIDLKYLDSSSEIQMDEGIVSPESMIDFGTPKIRFSLISKKSLSVENKVEHSSEHQEEPLERLNTKIEELQTKVAELSDTFTPSKKGSGRKPIYTALIGFLAGLVSVMLFNG